MARVQILAIPFALIPLVLALVPFILIQGWEGLRGASVIFRSPATLVLILLGGILLHELLHGAAWAWFGNKPLTTIRFGIQWKVLTPYAHCPEPLDARAYRIGALTPAVLLGVVPVVIATAGGPVWLFFPGLIFLVAAAGDFLIVWLLRGVHSNQLVLDHPDRAGCLVYENSIEQDQTA